MAQANAATLLQNPSVRQALGTLSELAVPVTVLAILMALIVPMPPMLLDVLLVIDIMLSVVVLMASMFIQKPVEFSVFPTALLLLTLFRLSLNVSSTRLILLNGNTGISAAGHVIESFGSFVVGGNYVIGFVIFLLLIAIQYVVINHGAVRISEVTARFTLDAMPGKQMSIDSDLNSGLIDETEARKRRRQLAKEAEFYGAMDGASRFTQRDAVASILVTGINVVAGFLIGVLQHGMEIKRAMQTYTVLTIGDGLVTVIPALMVSVCGGLVVTRAGSDDQLGPEFQQQLFGRTQPIFLSAGVLTALGLLPGLPAAPFLMVGGALGLAGWSMRKKQAVSAVQQTAKAGPAKENVEALLKVEPLTLEIGLGLVGMADGGAASPLLQRISSIRRQIANQLGYLLPPLKIQDNTALHSREYVIRIKGVELSRYELPNGHEMAIPGSDADPNLAGRKTTEPAFGLPALWITPDRGELARRAGYTVVDPISVLGTHLSELIQRHAHELFTRQDAKAYCDRVAQDNPKAVEELVPKLVPLATVQKVLQNLLRERVSVRDAGTILEAMGEAAAITRNPVLITEYVRQALRRSLAQQQMSRAGELPAFFLAQHIEQSIEAAVEHTEQNSVLTLPPAAIRNLLTRIGQVMKRPDTSAVLITSTSARFFLRQLVETSFPNLTVLSHNEIPPNVRVVSLGLME
ncbi:MAG: flagellar biosynthesis protein FlhA [Bryobacterales bacterium]|nr:flagellar biosynthesis protein FlhA [Bryobacterales bacterium]